MNLKYNSKKLLYITLFAVIIFFSLSLGYKTVKADNFLGVNDFGDSVTKLFDGDFSGARQSFIDGGIEAVKDISGFNNIATITEAAGSKLASVATSIMDEAFEGLGKNISETADGAASTLSFNQLLVLLGPSRLLFNWLFGDELLSSITKVIAIIGASIAIILFVLYCMTYLMSPDKVRVSPLKAIIRLILVAAFITSAYQTITYIEDNIMTQLYAKVISSTTPYSQNLDASKMYLHVKDEDVDSNGNTKGNFFGQEVELYKKTPYRFIPTIISLIMIIPILKELFKLIVECVERYIVFHLLMTVSPIAAATFTVDSTENVGKSYIQMIIAQFFLVSMSRIYIVTSIFVIGKTYMTAIHSSFLGAILALIMCLAVMKAFQRIDTYLRAMGIGVAQTSGALGDSIQSSLRNLGRSVGGALRGANNTRKNVGSGLQTLGANTGNRTAFNIGTALGASIANGGIPKGSALDKKWAEGQGSLGRTARVGAQSSRQLLSGYLQNFRGNATAAGALDKESKIAGARALTGLNVQSATTDGNGNIGLTWKDENGKEHSGNLSMKDNGSSKAIFAENGDLVGFLDTYPDQEITNAVQQGYIANVEGNNAVEMFENAGALPAAEKSDVFTPISADAQTDDTNVVSGEVLPASSIGYATVDADTGNVLGIAGTPISSISDDIDHVEASKYGTAFINSATGQTVCSELATRNGGSTMAFRLGATQYDPETGHTVATQEGAQLIGSTYEKNNPGSTVLKDRSGNYQVTYDDEKNQYVLQAQSQGSATVQTVYAKDMVDFGSPTTDGQRIQGDPKVVMMTDNRKHKRGIRFYNTGSNDRSDKD